MLRPSGVSSASDESWAASARWPASTPGAGSSSLARRLPYVMVPVLSSSRTSTSPAASTARPDMASTLRWTSRSMPAMPMADSSAPIVVGIRQTRSATSTTSDWRACEYTAMGCRVATASRKMIVSDARSTLSAISLGVFCRSEPSTSAIIRSTNVRPGSAVIRTTIWSDRTVVPPVTAVRSPPDSRITGADSPVMADSSTDATPSTTSPSPGIVSPAVTTTRSPTCSCDDATSTVGSEARPDPYASWSAVPWTLRAVVVRWVARRLDAWARPRLSATASARVANSTVIHSQTAITHANTLGSTTASTVVSAAPTSTTNMTGTRHIRRGSSLRRDAGSASRTVRHVSDPRGGATGGSSVAVLGAGWRVVLMRGTPLPGPRTGPGRR